MWRGRVPLRAGWARDGRGWMLTHGPKPAREVGGTPFGLGMPAYWPRILPRPFGATCIELAHHLGVPVRDPRPRLEPTEEGRRAVEARFKRFRTSPDEPFVAVNVGSREGSAKGVPPAIWARTLEGLQEATGLPLVVVCGPGEREALHAVLEETHAKGLLPCADPIVDLPELVALFARARLVVTADTGPRHIAVATGAPVVVAMGPTDPRHTLENQGTTRVVRVTVPCGPCHNETCPLTGPEHHACMTGLDPARLVAASTELLG